MEQARVNTFPDIRLHLRFLSGVVVAFIGALAVALWLLSPSADDMRAMTYLLGMSSIVSVAIGYSIYRSGLLRYSPRVSIALMGGYVLSSLLTVFNVWVTARLMFASEHDLLTAAVLLFFASGIAISFGYFISESLATDLGQLNRAAQKIAHGNLNVRVPINGRDELADLTRTFNEMAEQLQQADASRREAEQLRRSLIAWVGHDLRTPLASLRAMMDALTEGVVSDPTTQQRYFRTAQDQVETLSLLIDDLFDMAQLDAGGMSLDRHTADLSDLISDTIESFSALAKDAGITLSGYVAPDTDPVDIDGQKVSRVLSNLVSNALRYTPAGGEITILARPRDHDWVEVCVEDTGEGIHEEDLPHVFDQFYRGEKSRSRSTGGSGLGLAIARGVVEAHGGTISARSTPGEGTSIQFTLPRDGLVGVRR